MKANYDFGTTLMPLKTETGIAIPQRKAIIREDNGRCLGIVGNDYQITDHRDVVEIFDNIEFLTRDRVTVAKGGSIMIAQYEFIPEKMKGKDGKLIKTEVKVGDEVRFRATVFNSYNKQYCIGFQIQALRLVCTNGMVMPKECQVVGFKHFKSFNMDTFVNLVHNQLNQANTATDRWKKWLTIKPTDKQVENFYNRLTGMGNKIKQRLIEDSNIRKQENGLWGVYDSLTRFISHDLKSKKEEDLGFTQQKRLNRFTQKFYDYRWI